ncbi:MAG: hypothetical protein KF767_12900 [Bdellovibrionaceae bacterium]|nr:hypothetical protein [Pseudobdellovibrionaceae bacterium]
MEQNLGAMATFGEAVQQSFPIEKESAVRRVELTERDLAVLEFILEMKFARVRDVFQKFFKTTLSAEEAKSEAWAKKRLHQLVQARFLRVTYSHLDSERYFTTTLKAFNALATMSPMRSLAKPVRGFDHRTLLHDRVVIEFRLNIERQFGEVHWISDRRLKSEAAADYGLNSANVPDGIYTLPGGEVVAFELEIAQKARRRYRDKIENYVELIRERRGQPGMFRRVYFLCLKETVEKALREESRMYGDLIQIERRSFTSRFGGVL